ncbi:MAG: GNAT family N-acetyltransferase [Halobacteriales archaeon SW_9_67_25]|jgi:ribosomal protein S18 acetylase RimI-like enzyme|nr:MAG: GNAT family N-acetyltransferase [Halobacteriales archaeon SW_9_67_25]
MEIREARPGDRPAIRDVARRSMQASYSLDPTAIVVAIEEWYDENRLKDMLNDDDKLLLVVEADEQVVAFSDSVRTGESTAEILWLHVDPDYRGEDYGEKLFEATRNHLRSIGATNLRGRVLADNAGGNAFYERQGLVKVGEAEVKIDGTPFLENVYAEVEAERIGELELGDGTTVYVDHENQEIGSIDDFHVVYTTREGEEIYGYWCARCESFANAMDAMGRIQCDECGNARKPTRWDAAYM